MPRDFLVFRVQLEQHQNKNWENLLRFSRSTRFSQRWRMRHEVGKRMKMFLEVMKTRVLRVKNALTRCFVLTCISSRGGVGKWKMFAEVEMKFSIFVWSVGKVQHKFSYLFWFNKLVFQVFDNPNPDSSLKEILGLNEFTNFVENNFDLRTFCFHFFLTS